MTLDTAITQIVDRQLWDLSYSDLLPSILFAVFTLALFVTHALLSRMHNTYVEGYALIQSLLLVGFFMGVVSALHFHALHQSMAAERQAELKIILSHDFSIDATDFADSTFVVSYAPTQGTTSLYITTLSRSDLALLQQVAKAKDGILTPTSAQVIDHNLDVSLLVQR